MIILWILLLCTGGLHAQSSQDSTLFKLDGSGNQPKKKPKGVKNISVGGNYRFFMNYTAMKEQYPEFGDVHNRLFVGDDSQLPMLDLNIGLTPFKNTSFGVNLYMWTPMSGQFTDFFQSSLLGVKVTGAHSTPYGTFTVRTGGIHWCRLSPFTFGTNTGYNRYSLFERNPWDPNSRNLFDRYETYYKLGAINQDVRWGMQAFHGTILDGTNLPKGFSFSLMHGKSQLNGGTLPLPNTLTAGRVKKDFGKNFVSINGIRSQTFTDSLALETLGFQIYSTEYEFGWKDKLKMHGEIGVGNYFSPTSTSKWGEALDFIFRSSEELTFVPIELRYYQISPNVINNNGAFWNSSISEYNPDLINVNSTGGQTPLLIPFASSLVNIGQMTNNRRGVILTTDLKYKKHKLTLAYSVSGEMIGVSDRIAYSHPANNLALSRFWRWGFPANVGPYGNINKIYRGVFETAIVTDSIPAAKGFNSFEVSYKTNFKVFNRQFALFYLGGFYSVQDKWSVTPKYSDAAYLRSYNNQLEFYYQLTKGLVVSNYFGYDRILANESTALDTISLKPRNQEGFSYAIGADIAVSRNAGLYVRHRWIFYEDRSFIADRYRGQEFSLELKIFF